MKKFIAAIILGTSLVGATAPAHAFFWFFDPEPHAAKPVQSFDCDWRQVLMSLHGCVPNSAEPGVTESAEGEGESGEGGEGAES